MPKVTIWREGAIETEFDPGHRDWRMGRSETNDITLLDPRKSVSRFHAELREENGRWVFIDLNSQNGSWNTEGQRINRLVLEHGHEVLFGDYKLAFEDAPPVAPPPVPAAVPGGDTSAGLQTAPVAIAPDQTLLMPSAKGSAPPATPGGGPPPVMRQASKAKAPRKGVNPAILALFVLTMLGVVGALAWRISTDTDAPPPVTEAQPPVAPPDEPAAAVPPPASATPPAPAPASESVTANPSELTTPATPGAVTPTVAPPPPAAPAEQAVAAAPPRPATTPGAAAARPKRLPPAPKEAPALVARYEEGRRALNASNFTEAERAFEAVLSQNATFRDTAALLERARAGQVAAREKTIADAQAAEGSGDWSRAVGLYERAGASDRAAAARTKMQAAGDDAYRKARQFDARNRPTDAIGLYQRAVEWLPDSDPRKAIAQERLAQLKGGGA